MARFQYTRFETIYDNREQAIELLSGLSRLYAETVAVKYYDNLGNICIILGLYKSTVPGDFEISYETRESSGSFPRVFTVKRTGSQSNLDCINVALFGEVPINRDIVIITEIDNLSVTSLIYYKGEWELLSTPGAGGNVNPGVTNIEAVNTDTVNMEYKDGKISAKVNLDESSLVYDPEVSGIRVNKIYGGTF